MSGAQPQRVTFFPNTLDIDDLKHQFIKYSTMILQAVFVQSNTHHEQGW